MGKMLLSLLVLSLALTQLSGQSVITSQPTNQIVIYGSNVTFSVTVTGVGPFTYQWRFGGTNLPNGNNIITRAAGGGVGSAFSGDGGVATSAHLFNPSGVAVDSSGDLFIADSSNYRIRMVDTNFVSTTNGLIGIIRTIAGNGSGTYSGDGGMATNAGAFPTAVALDSLGNTYITDQGNNRIRKVDTNGIITTLAGTNTSGFSGDGGQATNAKLFAPTGVAVDGSGNLLIADWRNNRIRKIGTNGIITTVAGTNTSGFSGDGDLAVNARLSSSSPTAVAVDGFGNLFIADSGNNRIRKVDTNGIITTIAGTNSAGFSGDGGAATNASLNQPNGVAVDAYGDIFISDSLNNRIRMVDALGNIATVAGNGSTGSNGDGGLATNANLFQPRGVGLDSHGNLYVAGNPSSTIRKVDLGRTPMLQLYNVTATNAGNYDVVITSPSGSVTSSVVSLTVLLPPSITVQPTNVAVADGGPAAFNVVASGTAPFGYQWFRSSGRTATAAPFIFGGTILTVLVTSSGSGYSTVPQVQFVGGSGFGASATAVISNGMVISINLTSGGGGYAAKPPMIQIDPPSTIFNTALTDETNAVLALSSVTSVDATNYFVVVTNNYGSVTSATVALTVFLPPQNFIAQHLGTGLQLQFTGTPYRRYFLQSATNLTPPITWKSLYTNSVDASGNWQFTDTNLNEGQKFYRAMGQ